MKEGDYMSNSTKALTPQQAADIMGVTAQYVRIRMQRNLFNPPIGIADRLPGRERWSYRIFPAHLAEFMKIPVEEILRKI